MASGPDAPSPDRRISLPVGIPIPIAAIQDQRLSHGARGMYAYLCSLPYMATEADLLNASPDDPALTRSYMRELEAAGYLSAGTG